MTQQGKDGLGMKNPINPLYEHIIRGDAGDGEPNVLSADNTFVTGSRQTYVTKKLCRMERGRRNKRS